MIDQFRDISQMSLSNYFHLYIMNLFSQNVTMTFMYDHFQGLIQISPVRFSILGKWNCHLLQANLCDHLGMVGLCADDL